MARPKKQDPQDPQDPSETANATEVVDTGAAADTLPDGTPFPADAGALVHRDRSGKSMVGNLSEGAANFGAITAGARALVAESSAPPEDA